MTTAGYGTGASSVPFALRIAPKDEGAIGSGGPASFSLGYRRWLDGLRGLAVLAVLAFHLGLLSGGSFGVDVFFVLSGFLITCLLVQEWRRRGSISLRHFYLRRGLRILPPFLTLLLACFLYTLLFRPATEGTAYRKEALVALCFASNWPTFHGVAMSLLGHTWSLSLEEQFYLLWPALLCGLLWARVSPRKIALLTCAGILASAGLRCVLFLSRPPTDVGKGLTVMRLYTGLDSRADALLAGCLVGLMVAWDLLPKSRAFRIAVRAAAPICATGLGYIALRSCMDHCLFYYGLFTGVALMAAVLLVRLLSAPWRPAAWLLESPVLVGAGRISYALYLFHMPIIQWFGPDRLGWKNLPGVVLVAGLSVAAATLSYFCIERPCLRLKGRLKAPDATSVGSAAPPRRSVA